MLVTSRRRLTDLDAPDQAAALADVCLDRAERLLEDLIDVHLLEQPAAGRYHLHDLLRRFACTRACETLSETSRREAGERALVRYAAVTNFATRYLDAGRSRRAPRQ